MAITKVEIALAGPCCVTVPAVGSALRPMQDTEGLVRLAAACTQRQGLMHVQAAAPHAGSRRTGAQVPCLVRT